MTKKPVALPPYRPMAPGDLKPNPRNARTHSAAQIEAVVRSIREFGFTVPVLIGSDGVILAGHARVQAALSMGLGEVPVIELAHLSPAQRRAYTLADNALALQSGWDTDLLKLELGDLKLEGFDLSLTGFSDIELSGFLDKTTGRAGPDEVPEPLPTVITRRGDVWQMDKHRLVCGDSISAENGATVDMILTDPPYCSGGFQEAGKSAGSVGTRGTAMIANDTLSTRGYMALMRAVLPNFNAGVVYAFTDWRMWINLFDVVESSGFGVRNMIVWDKGTPGMGAGWRMQHELIMCGVRVKSPFNPKKAQGNVITCKRTGNILHATEKPVELLTSIIEVTDMARTIADPFCGSGSTIIAAEMTGRVCHGVELTTAYCDTTVRRWERFTGKQATLAATGATFSETAATREAAAAA
jgi:DNA modification methylase